MRKLPLAVVTMVYNEPVMLPLWLKYYSGQVGAEHCYVVDHGSDDYSVRAVEGQCSVTRLPRTPHDDGQRVHLMGRFTEALLGLYERVIYVDADEFIVPDPKLFGGLLDYCARQNPGVVTMFGFDLVHDFDVEPPLDLNARILTQRHWVRPSGFNCKPSLINRGVLWWNGFHGYDGGNVFDNIYLFHLANVDREVILQRQAKRNRSAPVDGGGGHHEIAPADMLAHVRQHYVDLERHTDVDFTTEDPRRHEFLSRLFEPGRPWSEQHMRNHGEVAGLWRLPPRFRHCF